MSDELTITTLAMGSFVDGFLVEHLPDGPEKDYVRMIVAKRHTPKAAPVEETASAPSRRPVFQQTALPSIAKNGTYQPSSTKQTSSRTPDDCFAEARNIIIETVDAKSEMPLPALEVLTGLAKERLTRFIESTIADYMQVKHIEPMLKGAAPIAKADGRRRPRSAEAKANSAAGVKAYHARRRAEKNAGWSQPNV